MDYKDIVIAIMGSLGLGSLVSYLLRNFLIEKLKNKLTQERTIRIEEIKNDLIRDTNFQLEILKSGLKKDTESWLGEHAAEREYILEARKKIYESIGPLHFQLLIACRDVWGRIWRHAVYRDKETGRPYPLTVNDYYGQSTLYRVLHPLAIAELAERRMKSFDLRIELCAIDLLKLKNSLYRFLSTSKLSLGHPRENFYEQTEHIFWDNLQRISEHLIEKQPDIEEKVISFSKFQKLLSKEVLKESLSPIISIFDEFDIENKSIFWIRLVCYGFVCKTFAEKYAKEANLKIENYSLKKLITSSGDSYFNTRIDKIIEEINLISKPQYL